MDDLDVNMAIWGIFLNTTLQAAVHLGQDYEANLRYVKNYFWNCVGQLSNETGKLISEQKEIIGVNIPGVSLVRTFSMIRTFGLGPRAKNDVFGRLG